MPNTSTHQRPVEITLYPDGPMLIRGPASLLAADGTPIERRRQIVAVCRCGRSSLAPWCDGTHKQIEKARQIDRARRSRTEPVDPD